MKTNALSKLLSKSEMKYAYNKDTKIYSVKFYIKRKGKREERILSMLVSPKYLEYSIADKNGDILEVIRQEGRKIKYVDFKKNN